MLDPRPDLLCRNEPFPRQRLCLALISQEAPDNVVLEFSLILSHGTL